jgi:hypothetical protein
MIPLLVLAIAYLLGAIPKLPSGQVENRRDARTAAKETSEPATSGGRRARRRNCYLLDIAKGYAAV